MFWLGLLHGCRYAGDMHRFYDVLVPFLTGKPFETSLVEAENAALRTQDRRKAWIASETVQRLQRSR